MTLDVYFSEDETVALLREKDLRGLHYLYNKFGAALHGVIFRILPDENLAQEALQQTFIKIWQQAGAFNPSQQGLYTWALQIARAMAAEKAKAAQIETPPHKQPLHVARHTDEEPHFPEKVGLPEIMQHLRAEQKELIDLIYFKGLSQSDAAARLHMPLGTVKNRVRSAMTDLRKLFQHAS